MTDPEKVLLGSSLPIYEVEEDEDRDIIEQSSVTYDMMNVINSLGTDDFKSIYLSLMPHIYEQPLDIQRSFCFELLDKVEKVYNYTFPTNLDFTNEYSVFDFYKFIEFLEFGYLDFLAKLWALLPTNNLKTINIASTCDLNSSLIVSKVDEVVKNNVFSKLVSLFLRSCSKEDLISFIIKKSTKDRMLVYLGILQLEESDGKKDKFLTM